MKNIRTNSKWTKVLNNGMALSLLPYPPNFPSFFFCKLAEFFQFELLNPTLGQATPFRAS